ncbi:hypothetical protein MNEG_4812 [Monoraphidium neglectum]|uniref:Protein Mpv17 n=1 Tax=Monoraphidium neglectum TaxID=145388 RepID=A0A0D2JWZ7_9CHLO|nr:hypothetical protein MNEG_4812 [Monoraphidium neglectum]KIZ03148.1 hypothetical protein MNEG_4812 [Monoraphidium neglectum]|eukprot:XP_013902167.1 hypothetical protein MNEG_4812 [Monoraphidium neglectum]
MGDLLAQLLAAQHAKSSGGDAASWDALRTLRMFGFGLAWYGPYQFYWYNLLDWAMPVKNTANFVTKVVLNQVALAPVVLAVVFSWNLALTGQAGGIPEKIQRDLVPSMVNGWKFWIPAASINFWAIPVDKQVLYMSCCGVLWTAYLSYASANVVGRQRQDARQQALPAPAPEPEPQPARKAGAKKRERRG